MGEVREIMGEGCDDDGDNMLIFGGCQMMSLQGAEENVVVQ